VPCAVPVRGKLDTKLLWVDAVNNDPCGKQTVASVNGVNVQAQNLCLPHYAAKWGLAEVKGVIVAGT
jgi:hypothetical protein